MAAILLTLLFVQEPVGEEIRTLLRRLESTSNTPAESAEIVVRLGQAVEQVAPGQARTLLGDALRADRLPAARRLDVAETLVGLEDRQSWTEEAVRIAQDASESAETRMRAALLLTRAGAPKAADVARTLAERLFSEGTEEAARALGTHLRGGTSRDQQRVDIDYLMKLAIPGARAALRDALADDEVDPVIRLEIAEQLYAAGALDRARDARAALERIKAQSSELAERADRLLAALRGIREDPAVDVAADSRSPSAKRRVRQELRGESPGRVNLVVGAATLVLLAVLVAFRRRS